MRKSKIINLFGGPCAGKSTTASGLFYELKKRGVNVELVSEWIKDKVFEGTKYPFRDELYSFAKQQKKLRQMAGKCDIIITDSPLPLTIVYATEEPMPVFSDLVMTYFNMYDNVNYLLKRNYAYTSAGRIQSSADEADKIADNIEKFLDSSQIKYKSVCGSLAVELILNDIVI